MSDASSQKLLVLQFYRGHDAEYPETYFTEDGKSVGRHTALYLLDMDGQAQPQKIHYIIEGFDAKCNLGRAKGVRIILPVTEESYELLAQQIAEYTAGEKNPETKTYGDVFPFYFDRTKTLADYDQDFSRLAEEGLPLSRYPLVVSPTTCHHFIRLICQSCGVDFDDLVSVNGGPAVNPRIAAEAALANMYEEGAMTVTNEKFVTHVGYMQRASGHAAVIVEVESDGWKYGDKKDAPVFEAVMEMLSQKGIDPLGMAAQLQATGLGVERERVL